MTTRKFAELVGTSEVYIYNILAGRKGVGLSLLKKVKKQFCLKHLEEAEHVLYNHRKCTLKHITEGL